MQNRNISPSISQWIGSSLLHSVKWPVVSFFSMSLESRSVYLSRKHKEKLYFAWRIFQMHSSQCYINSWLSCSFINVKNPVLVKSDFICDIISICDRTRQCQLTNYIKKTLTYLLQQHPTVYNTIISSNCFMPTCFRRININEQLGEIMLYRQLYVQFGFMVSSFGTAPVILILKCLNATKTQCQCVLSMRHVTFEIVTFILISGSMRLLISSSSPNLMKRLSRPHQLPSVQKSERLNWLDVKTLNDSMELS
jgi:hypothetical protein